MQTSGLGCLEVLNVPLTSSLALPRCRPNVACSPGLVSTLQVMDCSIDVFPSAQIDGKLLVQEVVLCQSKNLHEWAILTKSAVCREKNLRLYVFLRMFLTYLYLAMRLFKARFKR